MASTTHKLFTLTLLLAVLSLACRTTVAARWSPPRNHHGEMLAARLKVDGDAAGGGESNKCWDSLFQLQACTGEVISFFLNGETYLGPGCCRAIRVVGHDCWPAMLSSLGFTVEEAEVLLGYCDEDEQDIIHSPASSSPLFNNTAP
ncbi:egg cell-secreted protein 1.3-like [Neltuma alba]|uniref:egg cell-secreted protein 1.3-like n=1 Tax=Neltuma alba TaxID=207710 RepID=UPI0010A3F91A|nr:egg cell-secreted protein 1.3-like [Prosopis alba]XP_028757760.1 egg cell-secreted protein 1.3-like [Prosopis alba]